MSDENIVVESADFHRNGIGGSPFVIAIVNDKGSRMLYTHFYAEQKDGNPNGVLTSVVNVDRAAAGDIRFMWNSFRGDILDAEYGPLVDAFLHAEVGYGFLGDDE